ncbi:MAG: LacI family DNA-binding transcriptional regulator [Anaerolineae bacterium]
MPTTLQDIADRLNVSIATVSRALRDAPGVSVATRKQVLQVAEEMGYRPNVLARRLQKQRTETIGFIIPTFGPRFSDPFFSELLTGIGNEAAEHEYDLLVSTRAPGPEELRGYERMVRERRVDGLLVVRTRLDDPRIAYLVEHKFPFVAYGRADLDFEFPYVDVDGRHGMRELTLHLLEGGHRRIGYVSAPWKLMFAHYRYGGYLEALEARGVSQDESLVVTGGMTEASGYEAGRILLSQVELPTAIIACNDLMAIGVMRAVREAGMEVGSDVAVAGFDDIPLAKMTHPSLTTVRQPIYQIGRQICAMLLTLLAGDSLDQAHRLLQPELIVRQSTSPAP